MTRTGPLVAIVALVSLALMAACAPAVDPDFSGLDPKTDPKSFTCCANPERMPAAFARAAIDLSPAFSPLVSQAPIREGYLTTQPEAWSYLLDRARPLDILLTSGKNWIPGQVITGRFTHSAVYLGTEAELRALGLWDAPEVVPHHAAIRAGKLIIEGVSGGAKLNDALHIFDTDGAVLVRPALSGSAARREAGRRLFARIGVPFDYWFDVSTCDRLACTEMLAQSMPQIGFVVRPVYDIPMLMPDDIAAQAIRGENLRVVAYARGQAGGWSKGSIPELMEDIAASWGPVPADAPQVKLLRTDVEGLAGICTPESPRG